MHMKELPMFTYNLWMGTLPGTCTQVHHVNYCFHAVINIAMSNNFKYSHVQFTQFFSVIKLDLVIKALLLGYIIAPEKTYAYAVRASCYLQISIFEHF